MNTEHNRTGNADEATFAAAMPSALDSIYHELWTCGRCGREFGDCTSCVTHEQQCGGHLARW
jgi:hypothetical protein